mmetsp:Transcript_16976/g.30464  ORF Transcript_16976/g.30464 Transcript_16976/m.30464 type:complete len:322 (-) Transcript_16976:16-981(-)
MITIGRKRRITTLIVFATIILVSHPAGVKRRFSSCVSRLSLLLFDFSSQSQRPFHDEVEIFVITKDGVMVTFLGQQVFQALQDPKFIFLTFHRFMMVAVVFVIAVAATAAVRKWLLVDRCCCCCCLLLLFCFALTTTSLPFKFWIVRRQFVSTRGTGALARQPSHDAIGMVHVSAGKGRHDVVVLERFGTDDAFVVPSSMLLNSPGIASQSHVKETVQRSPGSRRDGHGRCTLASSMRLSGGRMAAVSIAMRTTRGGHGRRRLPLSRGRSDSVLRRRRRRGDIDFGGIGGGSRWPKNHFLNVEHGHRSEEQEYSRLEKKQK